MGACTGEIVGRVEESNFRDTTLKVGEEMCGTRRIREGMRRKGGEYRNTGD